MDRRICLHSLVGATTCLSSPTIFAAQDRLRIGLTPVILTDQMAFLTKWGRYLSGRVGCQVDFVSRESYQAILDLLFSGQVDAAWICGYPFVRFEKLLSLLAVPMYQNNPVYQAYLIRSKSSPVLINGWGDLKGKVLAFSDPLSNSGWLVAQAQMALAGVASRDLKRTFFASGHRNVAEAVGARLAHAGSIDGYVWETMRILGMSAVAQTEVIWKSQPFGFPPLVTLQGTNHPFIPALQVALLTMTQEETGRDLLRALNLTGFTTGTVSLFDAIRKQAQSVPGSGVAG